MRVLELDVLRIEKGEILDLSRGVIGGHKLSFVGIGSKSFPSGDRDQEFRAISSTDR